MTFPFSTLVAENYELGLVVAVGIGFGFGFVLERAGFGRATKLAAQFYGYDMTVFKVMFGAIVTAMAGLVIASGLGLIDLRSLSESAASPTYLWPMLVGGLLLGAGFIISGYCPGTSMVAAASGNLDGLVTFVGVIVGSVVYGQFQPYLTEFHYAGDLGHVFLYDLLSIPPAVMAAGVVLMAVGGFLAAEKLEKFFAHKFQQTESLAQPQPKRRFAFATLGLLTLVGLGVMFVPVGQVQADAHINHAHSISQVDFAKRLLSEPWRMRILDIRSLEHCSQKRIPNSQCVPSEQVADLGLQYAPGAQDLVIVSNTGQENLPSAVFAFKGKIYNLQDGFSGWRDFALRAPALPTQQDQQHLELYHFRSALHQAMTGARAAPVPAGPVKKYVPKKKRKGGGCS